VVPQLRHAAAGGAGAGGDEAVARRHGMMGAMSPLMFNYQPLYSLVIHIIIHDEWDEWNMNDT